MTYTYLSGLPGTALVTEWAGPLRVRVNVKSMMQPVLFQLAIQYALVPRTITDGADVVEP
jgi:hypothetical protein